MFQSPEDQLSPYLDKGERLLWCGQPRGGVRLRPQDALMIPFSLLWGGFAIFWEYMVLHIPAKSPGPVGIMFPLFGIPFVTMGLYIIFGRFFVDAKIRAHTYYGVTGERIIILSGLFSQQMKSLQLRALPEVTLSSRSDGSGNIAFGSVSFRGNFMPAGAWPGAGRYAPPSFDLIENAREVYDIMRKPPGNSNAFDDLREMD
jgi:hypothetical protein